MGSSARYNHLPGATAYLLSDWQYKGERPSVVPAESVVPTVAFSTVDVKLPETGHTKVLELNGYESGLDAYGEERREDSIIGRANSVNDSLGIPLARFRWVPKFDTYLEISRETIPHYGRDIRSEAEVRGMIDDIGDPFTLDSKLTALQSDEVRQWLNRQRSAAKVGGPELRTGINDMTEAPLLIELSDSYMPIWSDFDPEDALVANPAEIRVLEEDKLAFASLVAMIGLEDYRPRFSRFLPAMPDTPMTGDLRQAEDVEQIVLKYPKVDAGRGITVMEREEFVAITNLAGRIGTWGAMLKQLGGNGFTSRREAFAYSAKGNRRRDAMEQLIVEEYIPSKPVKAPDGRKFDATMRLVITSLANRGKVTIIPLGAYWKLPSGEMGASDSIADSQVSRIKDGKGSLPVSNADFKRAFRDVSHFMTQILAHTRSAAGSEEYNLYRYLDRTTPK